MTHFDSKGRELKVDDRVRIVQDATDGRYVGKEGTVVAPTSSGCFAFIQMDDGGRWEWTPSFLERIEVAEPEKRPSERVANLLQEWHRASQFSSNVGDIIRVGDTLIDALLAEHGLPNLDTAGSASRQHYIETGRYLYEGESF